MKNISLELDIKPSNMNILTCFEYNSFFVSQFLYARLIDNVNCTILTNDYQNYIIQLHDYWKQRNINSAHFVNVFTYYYNHRDSAYRVFVPFIKSKGKELGIKSINAETIEINLIFPYKEFKDMVQSRYIVPIEQNKVLMTGEYAVNRISEKKLVLKNKEREQKLYFYFNSDYYKTSEYFCNNIIDITCPVNDSPKIEIDRNYIYIKQTGSLVYYCYSKIKDLAEYIAYNRVHLNRMLEEILGTNYYIINSFYIDKVYQINHEYEIKSNVNTIKTRKVVSICYSNYYPNEEIALIIKNELLRIGVISELVKFDSFDDYIKRREYYDIYIGVTYPQYDNMHSISMNLLGALNQKERNEYAKLLFIDDKEGLYRCMQNAGGYVPLAISNFRYYKKPNINFTISEYGYVQF